MKSLFKLLFKISLYCLFYLCAVNISASYINRTLDTVTLQEITSIEAMRSGQNDIFTFIEYKIKNIDVKSLREEVLKEIQKF